MMRIRFARSASRVAAAAGLWLVPMIGALAEDITVSTYYPSPRGIYQELRTMNNTFLATLGGNVGIGTIAPNDRLAVVGALPAGFIATRIQNTDATGYSALALGGADEGLVRGGATAPLFTNQMALVTAGAIPVAFYTNSVQRAVVDGNSGNVGIATAAPLSRLDVNGGVAIGIYAGVNAAPANGVIASGNVGIGTAAPAFPLDVQGRIGGKLDGGAIDGALQVDCSTGACYAVYAP